MLRGLYTGLPGVSNSRFSPKNSLQAASVSCANTCFPLKGHNLRKGRRQAWTWKVLRVFIPEITMTRAGPFHSCPLLCRTQGHLFCATYAEAGSCSLPSLLSHPCLEKIPEQKLSNFEGDAWKRLRRVRPHCTRVAAWVGP